VLEVKRVGKGSHQVEMKMPRFDTNVQFDSWAQSNLDKLVICFGEYPDTEIHKFWLH
jgi:hypothetical protein